MQIGVAPRFLIAMQLLAALKCTSIPRQSSSNRRCSLSQFQSVVLRERIDVDPERMDDRRRHQPAHALCTASSCRPARGSRNPAPCCPMLSALIVGLCCDDAFVVLELYLL